METGKLSSRAIEMMKQSKFKLSWGSYAIPTEMKQNFSKLSLGSYAIPIVFFLTVAAMSLVYFISGPQQPQQVYSSSFIQTISEEQVQAPRIAICLAGGARHFEITGPTLKKYVLDEYRDADLFLHSPLDPDTYKFFIMDGDYKFISARIFKPVEFKEGGLYEELLNPIGSPKGRQGLLQYMNLIEGCWQMISNHEELHNFHYDWIIRLRVDSYWTGPLQPIHHFNKSYYTVPLGSSFSGLNDRLGIGDRESSALILQRLSVLPRLHEKGFRNLHSEWVLLRQMEYANVTSYPETFPFCILSHRAFGWPLGRWDVPIVSMNSSGNFSGVYCRPCTPMVSGPPANVIADNLDRGAGWFPHNGSHLSFCVGTTFEWEPQWEDMVDSTIGPDLARLRRATTHKSLVNCELSIYEFQQKWRVWDSPSPQEICHEYYKNH